MAKMGKSRKHSKWKDPAKDSRSNEKLFAESLKGKYEARTPWDAIWVMRLRGTKEVFDLAKEKLNSKRPIARARALDVLGQLGAGKPDTERPYIKMCVSLAIKAMEDEKPIVVHSAAWALAHLKGSRAVSRLIQAKKHRMQSVRHAVAFGLGGPESPAAIKTLMELMEDRDKGVRDWATFSMSLSWPTVVDSQAIRKALRKRLKDASKDVRSEAVWGLARRKDIEGLKLLLGRLEAKYWTMGDQSAAEETLDVKGGTEIGELRKGIRDLIAAAR